MAAEDREALEKFLADFYLLVRQVLEAPERNQLGEGAAELHALWQSQESRINDVRGALFSGGPALDAFLRDVGLVGDELRWKLALYYAAVEAYEADPTTARLRDVLEAANITLRSLGLFFPVIHSVEEIKEIVEYLLDRGRDWFRDWLWPFVRRSNDEPT